MPYWNARAFSKCLTKPGKIRYTRNMGRPAGLTERQRTFAKYYVEGRYSNAECARKAGYAEKSAAVQAAKLLDGHSLLTELHAVHLLDGLLRRILRLEVHEPVTLRLSLLSDLGSITLVVRTEVQAGKILELPL